MTSPLQSLIETGTKLWVDSIDPQLISESLEYGATGATSNPIIISNIIGSGILDAEIAELGAKNLDAEAIAWELTDQLVSRAEKVFKPFFDKSSGNDGFVSFELDPLLEDPKCSLDFDAKVSKYVEEGIRWSQNHPNRLIKVPATRAGLQCLEKLVAAGVNVNVTLLFTMDQYLQARQAVWKGAQQRPDTQTLKSVFSIFISRIDVYTLKHNSDLSSEAQGQVGILNAKRIWSENKKFWEKLGLKNAQEMVFASTGTKDPNDKPWKYVGAFAGSDIETNPPETNQAIAGSHVQFERTIDTFPEPGIIQEIDDKVDWVHLEKTLMNEGIEKFALPQKNLIQLIKTKLKS